MPSEIVEIRLPCTEDCLKGCLMLNVIFSCSLTFKPCTYIINNIGLKKSLLPEFITLSPEFFLVECNRISPTHFKTVSTMFSNLMWLKNSLRTSHLKKKFQASLGIFIRT